jgi:cytochrome c-type biogenesis protein CcmE
VICAVNDCAQTKTATTDKTVFFICSICITIILTYSAINFFIVLFCLPKKVPKKGTRNRYTARFREGALISFGSPVASAIVTLLLGSNSQLFQLHKTSFILIAILN